MKVCSSEMGLVSDCPFAEQAERSFITVVIAFIVSRLLLAMQYAICERASCSLPGHLGRRLTEAGGHEPLD